MKLWKKPTTTDLSYTTAKEFAVENLGCMRLVYNKALAERMQAWQERRERISYNQTSKLLTKWKKQEDFKFLNDVSSVPLQQGLRHLETAFKNFFAGRAKYPTFKKKRQGGSAEFTKSAFRWKAIAVWRRAFYRHHSPESRRTVVC